jgi:hypothetical protein
MMDVTSVLLQNLANRGCQRYELIAIRNYNCMLPWEGE